MRTIIRQLIFLNQVRKGVIPVSQAGFWQYRSRPEASLKQAVKLFNRIQGKVIVEIGTGLHSGIAGQSIKIWSRYSNAEKIYAVDLDDDQLSSLNHLKQKDQRIHTVKMDGLKFLDEFEDKISLLYLDFWAPDREGEVEGTQRACQYREAYEKAKDKMADKSLILIDDCDHILPWKHSQIIPEARKDGFNVVWMGRQTLVFRDEGDG